MPHDRLDRVPVTERIEVRRLRVNEVRAQLEGLAAVLHDCVAGGASVSYMAPFSLEQARNAFEGFVADAEQGRRLILAAFVDGDLVGTVQVILALPPNQPSPCRDRKAPRSPPGPRAWHRPEAHGARRGRGASGGQDTPRAGRGDRRRCRTPLCAPGLDHGRCDPGYALYPDGRPCDTTVFWKAL